MRRVLAGFALTVLLYGCASTDRPAPASESIHYGSRQTLHLCVLKSVSLSLRRAEAYLAQVRNDLVTYRLILDVTWIHPWEQPGDGSAAILADLSQRPLDAPCDRIVALVDRTGAAFVSGLLLPEVSGEADAATSTRGYIELAYTAPNPFFRRAEDAAVLRFHALLGCTSSMSSNACEHRIAELKAATDPESGFLPGITPDGAYLSTRADVNEALSPRRPR
jgi:hypothetical protein